jgi:hypothetical protein
VDGTDGVMLTEFRLSMTLTGFVTERQLTGG